jgi:hypothetical protein
MSIEIRIARLESYNRALIFGVAILTVAVAALATVLIARVPFDYEARMRAQATANEEYFRSLRTDLEVAELALEKQIDKQLDSRIFRPVVKALEFHVVDKRGKSLIVLGGTATGGTLGIHNGGGQLRVALGVTTDDHGLVGTLNSKGDTLVELIADGTGGGLINTYDPNGTRVVSLSRSDNQGGMIQTYDGAGSSLVTIGATTDGEGAIATFNRNGEVRKQWP